jgi:hypothetical protein
VEIGEIKMGEKLELVSEYNKARREVKIELVSSGIWEEMERKSEMKKRKKLEMGKRRDRNLSEHNNE